MAEHYDVVVIGGGPGGYAAAIRCAQRGARTALVEKAEMGGTCLNRGCIPSKALLGSAHFLTLAKHASLMGLEMAGPVRPNWAKMMARKDAIVEGFRKGVTGLVQSNQIALLAGRGIVAAPGTVRVEAGGGVQEIACKKIILATGSVPVQVPIFPFDGRTIISSTEALSLPAIPASMVIIGGGVIGCELASVYSAVGCKVTIVEALSQLLPNEDEWVGSLLARELRKGGIESMVARKVTAVDPGNGKARVTLEGGESIEAEKVLVAVGRKAFCDPETLAALKPEMNGPAILVNRKMETSVAGVYAIGDLVGTTYLAHGAFAEAEVAAANATGSDEEVGDYERIPRAVYTFPEVASVGKTEKKCQQQGIAAVVGKAPFRANGRSLAHNETVGEVRVIRDASSKAIVGVTIVGATATEMISTARAMMGSHETISEVSFAHPTVTEVLKEAWEDAFGMSLHVPPKGK